VLRRSEVGVLVGKANIHDDGVLFLKSVFSVFYEWCMHTALSKAGIGPITYAPAMLSGRYKRKRQVLTDISEGLGLKGASHR
jgi:hypothetical protein